MFFFPRTYRAVEYIGFVHLYTQRKATARVETYLSCFVEVDILMVLRIFVYGKRKYFVQIVQAQRRQGRSIRGVLFRGTKSGRAYIRRIASRCEDEREHTKRRRQSY